MPVIAYRPLELGLLSGKYHHANRPTNLVRTTPPLFLPQNLEARPRSYSSASGGCGRALCHPGTGGTSLGHPPPGRGHDPGGASSVEQLESNVAAADIDLADDEYRALQAASARFHPAPGPGFLSRQACAILGHPSAIRRRGQGAAWRLVRRR